MVICENPGCDEPAEHRVMNGAYVEKRCDEHTNEDSPHTTVIGRV